MEKKYKSSMVVSLSKEFIALIDKILKENPDFKNRSGVVRYAVRYYYERLLELKKK